MDEKTKQPPKDWREARRIRAWELHQQGWRQKDSAEALGVTAGSVSQWFKRGREEGLEALRSRRGGGPKPRLSHDQLAELKAHLAQGAEHFGEKQAAPFPEQVTTWRMDVGLRQHTMDAVLVAGPFPDPLCPVTDDHPQLTDLNRRGVSDGQQVGSRQVSPNRGINSVRLDARQCAILIKPLATAGRPKAQLVVDGGHRPGDLVSYRTQPQRPDCQRVTG